ncbi:iron uptake porin [Spirulina sp. 06S082]|uniref:iron uptake porin n=1 Tax=Spirulina sp. 06S082 TaxID=3110248 RepID=UPI002B2175FF|nr:iron uptake porin [Spirulina sp. 06S082]MEA5470771.1 iron uptake porin [Spirulina sp. 06S082]
MKSQGNLEKALSSALLLTSLGILADPAVAVTTAPSKLSTSETPTSIFLAGNPQNLFQDSYLEESEEMSAEETSIKFALAAGQTDPIAILANGAVNNNILNSEAIVLANAPLESSDKSDRPFLATASQNIPLHPLTRSALLESGLDTLIPMSAVSQPQVWSLATTNVEADSKAIAQTETGIAVTPSTSPEVMPSPAIPPEETLDPDPMAQVNDVFELRDVSPGDWAFQALSDLIERYGCLAGYPNGTFRGDRAMTRYEFAAGLNSCLQQIERIIAGATGDLGSKEDMEVLERLMREFEVELAALSTKVDNLEARVQFLEDNAFSTTTKLFGQAILGVTARSANNNYNLAGNTFIDQDTETTLLHNVQLSLFTQFSPRSLLLTSFQAGDGSTITPRSRSLFNYVGLAFEGDSDNNLSLSDLNYRHLITNNFALMVGPKGMSPVNVFRGTNRVESAGSGPISRFAQRNPILSIGNGDSGIGFDWQINNSLSLQGVYGADFLADGINGSLFGGDLASTSFGLQLVVSPSDNIDVTLQYINAYSPFGFLGTSIGDDRLVIGNNSSTSVNLRAPMTTNAFGIGLEWRIIPEVTFGSWFGYTASDYVVSEGIIDTINWMTFLNFNDLGGEGNLLGIYFGQPPRIISSTMPAADNANNIQARNVPSFFSNAEILTAPGGGQPGRTYHLEAFYRIKITDYLTITPGAIVLFNPLHNSANDTIVIGALRTTFTF